MEAVLTNPLAGFGRLANFATVLTTVGATWVRDKLNETIQTTGDYIGWGTGAGTAAVADTTLFTESAEARTLATRTVPAANMVQWVGTLTATAARSITNAGNFTASTAGTLIVHGDFTAITLSTGDQITFTIQLSIS